MIHKLQIISVLAGSGSLIWAVLVFFCEWASENTLIGQREIDRLRQRSQIAEYHWGRWLLVSIGFFAIVWVLS